jgi:hypothetical protein
MMFFSDALQPLHEVCKALKSSLESDKLPTKANVQEWLDRNKETAEAIHKRLFIIMTAQVKGWPFAKKLEFYENGMSYI